MSNIRDKIMLRWAKIGNYIYKIMDESIKSEKPQLVLTTALSCLSVLIILNVAWPIEDVAELAVTIVFIILALAISVFISKYLLVSLLIKLAQKSQPLASSYEQQVESINRGKGIKKEKPQGLGVGPAAEVSIKYFIEKEKTTKLYNARYIGPV